MLGQSYLVRIMAVLLVLLGVPGYVHCDLSLREEHILPKPTTHSRENGSHENYMFDFNYQELKSVSKGWEITSLRERILPYFLMFKGVFHTISHSSPLYYISLEIQKHVSRITKGVNRNFVSLCDENLLSQAGLASCSISSTLMDMLSFVVFTKSVLMEASVRTRLLVTSNKFTSIPDNFSTIIKGALATEMIALEHVLTTFEDLLRVVNARYLQGPMPIPGTEDDFVKAIDYLYVAISDLILMSKLIYSHTLTTISKSEDSAWVEQDIVFAASIVTLATRGVPSEYDSSPFPPLTYFWDITALNYAISTLADMGSLINRTLENNEGTRDPLIDTELLSTAAYAIRNGHAETLHYFKNNELQKSLYSATAAVRYAMPSLRKAGLHLHRDETWEELKNHFMAIMNKMNPTTTKITYLGIDLIESISKATARTILHSYETTLSDYNSMIAMVTDVASIIAQYARTLDTSAWPRKISDVTVDELETTMDMLKAADFRVSETTKFTEHEALEATLQQLDDELREKIENGECEDPNCLLAVFKEIEEISKSSFLVRQLHRELKKLLNI